MASSDPTAMDGPSPTVRSVFKRTAPNGHLPPLCGCPSLKPLPCPADNERMENGNAEERNQEQIAALHEANRRASEKNQRERVAALKRAKVLRSIGWALIVLALGAATSHGTASLDPGSGEDQLVIFTYFGMIITGCMLLARAKGSSILKVWVGFILLFCELFLLGISPVLAFILLFLGLCAPFAIKYLREKRQREAEAAASKRR